MIRMVTVEDFVNAHVFIHLEMVKREIKHPDLNDELDELAKWIVEEYSIPTGEPSLKPEKLRLSKPRITLKEFIDMLPNTIIVEGNIPDIIVAGSIVNKGVSEEGHDIDIFVLSNEVDRRIIASFLRSLKEEDREKLKDKIRFHFDKDGGSIGYFVPIYRKAFQKVSLKGE